MDLANCNHSLCNYPWLMAVLHTNASNSKSFSSSLFRGTGSYSVLVLCCRANPADLLSNPSWRLTLNKALQTSVKLAHSRSNQNKHDDLFRKKRPEYLPVLPPSPTADIWDRGWTSTCTSRSRWPPVAGCSTSHSAAQPPPPGRCRT